MLQEQETTLAGLQTALQMEEDGREFYIKASKNSQDKRGRQLLEQLAEEESIHQKVFKNIYDNIKKKNRWPDKEIKLEHKHDLKTVFAEAVEKMNKEYKAMPEELDAVKTGMDMENKTLDFYRSRSAKTGLAAEKQLYDSIAMQESEHFRLLQDYFEFLSDPAGYFIRTERHSVDGG